MLERHLANKFMQARMQMQADIVWPIKKMFLNPLVINAILLNPTKLLVVMCLYKYWDDVSKRGFLRFATTGGDNNNERIQITENILHSLVLSNQHFLQQVRQNIAPLQAQNSELYTIMNKSISVLTVARDHVMPIYPATYFIQMACILGAYATLASLGKVLFGEASSALFEGPASAFLAASILRSLYDHAGFSILESDITPGRTHRN